MTNDDTPFAEAFLARYTEKIRHFQPMAERLLANNRLGVASIDLAQKVRLRDVLQPLKPEVVVEIKRRLSAKWPVVKIHMELAVPKHAVKSLKRHPAKLPVMVKVAESWWSIEVILKAVCRSPEALARKLRCSRDLVPLLRKLEVLEKSASKVQVAEPPLQEAVNRVPVGPA